MSAGKRAERRELNRQAHAVRRELTNRDYREARERGDALTWRAIWETYAAIPAADVMRDLAPLLAPPAAAPEKRARRGLPPHLRELHDRYTEARAVWQAGLEEALAGARRDGRPARGERYTDEERDYRAAHPAPIWREWLEQYGRERRGMAEAAAEAGAA